MCVCEYVCMNVCVCSYMSAMLWCISRDQKITFRGQ